MSNPSAGSPWRIPDFFSRTADLDRELLPGPIRGELLGAEQLADRARAVARGERLREGRRIWRAPLLARLNETRRLLDAAYHRLNVTAERADVGPAGDWLLDNYHVVQEHIREVYASLPKSYYRELPELDAGPLAGYPRVYELAITLVSHTEGRIDADALEQCVTAFQEISPIRIGELWAIPAMLRLGLIENVRRMTLRTVQRMDEVERADRMATALLDAAAMGSAELGNQLVQLIDSKVPLNSIFISRFLQRLRLAPGSFAPLGWLEQWIADEGMPGEAAAALATHRLAITQVVMANSITSLRTIARFDWPAFVERQSVLDAELRMDPSGFYPRMTFGTRDHYRHVVERIATRTKTAEAEVARMALDLARAVPVAPGSDPNVRTHVGYFLVDEGLRELESRTGYRPRPRERLHRAVLRHPNTVFFGSVLAGTAAALVALIGLGGPEAPAAWIPLLLLGLIPASEVALTATNRILVAYLPPRILPKLDMREHGVPAELRTAVVIPTLFASVDAVAEALETIEVRFLANRQPHLHFALLSDFTDAATETTETDAAILGAAVSGVDALNARYAPETRDAFFLFHRPRRWNAGQNVWMGWERKRGKLAEFNHFVRGGAADAFSTIVGNVASLKDVRYIITLDSDTVLPPDAASQLIGTMAHPLNRAIYDPAAGRIVRGYGILQPRVGVSLLSASQSVFAAVQSGQPGVDPYSTAVSDVYQDLYGEGSFTGKGIYDVDAFERATQGRFPENRLLSHDLIEGSYARAGLVTDISVYDDYPAQYLTYTRRKHRWIRGDWQLLQWLTPRVPGPEGAEPNRLSPLSRWKIFDNLRRSAVEIGLMVFLVAGWFVLPGSPTRWTLLATLALSAPWILSLALAVARPPLDASWLSYYAAVGRDAVNSAWQVALAITFLPHQAWISIDGIARTLWRLAVSHRHLLEWQTASHAERGLRRVKRPWVPTLRAMWPMSAASVAALLLVIRETGELTLVPLFAMWIASPIIAGLLGRQALRKAWRMPAEVRDTAMRYARVHWNFYERFATEGTHWLAPDNYQEIPTPVVAMRTSPTNIGLQLLATVSAHDLGIVPLTEMVERLERILRTMEGLRRFRGHFFNWYDLHDLRVLEPPYISTVDSGNLAGHLLALRQACLEARGRMGADPATGDMAARLQVIADRAADFANQMDFRFLYDEKRELFAIGYQHASHSLDSSFYDLLASEARLASFLAVARNDVPVEHWFHLGRTLTRASGETALLSWSGSMFEYLMPTLVMKSFPQTLLAQTYHGAVSRQISFGREHRIPWGTSESAYNVRDRHHTYQYRAFGVPGLALERRIGQDLVVAPYATALALAVDPKRAFGNLAVLDGKGALGEFGFYDALDYTRPAPGARYTIVRNFMAHHVGMSLVALTNQLTGNVWPRRFHADPLVQAAELLLHERIPRRLVFRVAPEAPRPKVLSDGMDDQPAVREVHTPDTPRPRIALLGRLPYTIMISSCGSGYSRYGDLAVTRWRADATSDDTGQFCYIRDVAGGQVWSAAHQPVCSDADSYVARLATDRVTFERVDHGIETRTEIAVVPDDAAEVRRITVFNQGDTPRELEITSYGEIVLNTPGADRQHPAFSNLFVETEWHEWCTAITATRRPRSASEKRLWCAHVVDTGGAERIGPVSCETDRARFLGRGRGPRAPMALEHDGPLSGSIGAVLDPIFALRVRIRLAPGQTASVAFTTLMAETRERVFVLADRYHNPTATQRGLDLSWTATQVELRELGITSADAAVFQELAGQLFYSNPAARAPEDELRNAGAQPLLWAQAISGDWPILLARLCDIEGIPTITALFAAHHFWRRRGMTVDLVVLNEQASGYLQTLNDAITGAMFGSGDSAIGERPGGVFIRRLDQIAPAELAMLRATARIIIDCDGRSLEDVAQKWRDADEVIVNAQPVHAPARAGGRRLPAPEQPPHERPSVERRMRRSTQELRVHADRAGDAPLSPLRCDNGIGGFTAENDYEIRVRGDALPPAPWSNVIANERGGCIVTERGMACTWLENAQFYRLTPWHNDPVTDPPSDALYLRDEESGELWSPTPAPMSSAGLYTVRHSAGTTEFTHRHSAIETCLTVGMAATDPVRIATLHVANHDDHPRHISITAYVEWTLATLREHSQHQVMTAFDGGVGAHIARNPFNPVFATQRAFAAISEPVSAHTADRREFLGRNGSLGQPDALAMPGTLSGATFVGVDPCSVQQCVLHLAAGESRVVVFLLGAGADEDEARAVIARYRTPEAATAELAAVREAWKRRLSVVTVRTPEPTFDAMINRWSLYQTLSCRVWGRAAVYQSSGAFGFRDQLQDVMALLYAEPALARAHIIRAAGRQFPEGDVQHWWHPPEGRGVRTRFSDDLAWLPFVVEQYVRVTGDRSVLDEKAGFITMRALREDEHELYDLPQPAGSLATVYEHCVLALDRACTTGARGLPLIGIGDWNDGMNRVGVGGQGESVWLGWFLTTTLRAFAAVADDNGDAPVAERFRARATAYAAAVEASGWDGDWYRRAYFDDGTPLGSAASEECRIDSIAQSWSVISGAGDPARQRTAMASVERHLVHNDEGLIQLLTPPFDRSAVDPGYIKGYLPGVRENGAQYTHAALWVVQATAMLGDGARALELYQMINPIARVRDADAMARYRVEPYVLAADVYTADGQHGRGGWTWYTGSASWMYRVGLESILGLVKRGDMLFIDPRVPPSWTEYRVEYRHGATMYEITVKAATDGATVGVTVNGVRQATPGIALKDDGARREVVVTRP